MEGGEAETHLVVHGQLRDIVLAQQRMVHKLEIQIRQHEKDSVGRMEFEDLVKELEDEKLEHSKTKASLSKESEKLQFALGEIEVLMKQLEREKKAFEQALESIKNKALKESTKNDKLITKCSAIENQMEKQEDILTTKDNQIKDLCHLLSKQKEALRKQTNEFEIQKQQDAYIARVLETKTKTKKMSIKSLSASKKQ
ncbi:spermatogenesis-associated protein 24 isoform X2 [Callorhinchus milii]|uniref:Spermatogenesis-associated protein 24-like protein n=1 Tax=Callorhinchus milii TaxID=7868 RepID=V9LDH8_CALMI|nr:spermatogenesis-associated protein 24 isoform X2 [Callorhinchus milii]|eukprot:gi/632957530/ref/XP_007894530.1/ PREDICTED: spermatogenesis-associated protein 24 [Callorhinchus milii]